MYGCGEQEVGVASGSGWNLWVWLLGVVVRRYISPHCHPYFERAKFKVWMSIVESGCNVWM